MGAAPKADKKDPGSLQAEINLHTAVAAHLREARQRNVELQKNFADDSACWHHCKVVDDRLNDAMRLLGE